MASKSFSFKGQRARSQLAMHPQSIQLGPAKPGRAIHSASQSVSQSIVNESMVDPIASSSAARRL